MPNPFPVSDAAIRAVQGGSDVNNLLRALHDDRMARIVALAPDAHRGIRAVAALSGGMTALLDESDIADPALHDALARLIGTQDMRNAFRWRATIAPAGWGRAYADALVDGALQDMDSPRAIAALIEPSNAAAALVTKANDMAWVIRRWGQSTPDTPTAWMHSLSSRERNRLLHAVRQFSFAAASCLPWLPPNRANQGESAIGDLADLTGAINAFVIASPYARAHHASLVQRLVARAYPAHLGELTHLACAIYSDEVGMQALARAHDHPFAGHRGFASFVRRLVARAHLVYPGAIARQTCGIGSEDVWNRVRMLIHESPDDAWRVVTAAPWDDLAETARAVILECANRSDTCAAVAAARGRKRTGRITPYSAVAFFAALDPKVWDEIPSDEQRRWRDALPDDAAHLAVRSLGLRPEFLARARLDNTLVHAARRHARRASALCWRLLPVALHDIPLDAAHAIMTVLPTPPPEPGVFFVTAGGHSSPSVIAIAHTALREPSDLACAVVLQCGALSQQFIRDRCAALQEALRGRSWKDMESIAPPSLMSPHDLSLCPIQMRLFGVWRIWIGQRRCARRWRIWRPFRRRSLFQPSSR